MNDFTPAPAPPLWEREIQAWTGWLRASGRPPSTIYMQTYHLRRCGIFHDHRGPWTLTLEDITDWLASFHGWSAETRRSYRGSLRSFYRWGTTTGRITVNPTLALPAVRAPLGRPRPTPESVVDAALAGASYPERLMVRLAAYAGLRRAEIAQAHTRDVLLSPDGWSLRVCGKGARVRMVPLSDQLAADLLACGDGFLFPGQIDGHLSPAYVGKRMSRLLGPGWTAHTLRHRFATRAYAAERDLRAVMELLGHTKPETTARYTAVPDGALRRAVAAATEGL